MESGFALLFASAVYPPIVYRESGRSISSVPAGILYGGGTAAAIYIIYLFVYRLISSIGNTGITAEAATFVAVSMLVFASALFEKRYVNTASAPSSDG